MEPRKMLILNLGIYDGLFGQFEDCIEFVENRFFGIATFTKYLRNVLGVFLTCYYFFVWFCYDR